MKQNCDTARIRELNDAFRTTFTGGRVMMTNGVDALGPSAKAELLSAVRSFSSFTTANDPYCEHDFGSIEVEGQKFLWKIDYYDMAMGQHSVDATNPEATIRVLTIMRADEY